MKKLYWAYFATLIIAPIVFTVYLKFDLVCAARAPMFEIVTGAISGTLLMLSYKFKKYYLYMAAAIMPIYTIICAPIIMLGRLGYHKFINDRLLAYATFELFAIIQLVIIGILLGVSVREQKLQPNNAAIQ